MKPVCHIVAGPNGSGKTTLKRRLERDDAVNFYDFLNADEIFAEVKETGAYAPRLAVEPDALAAFADASSYDASVKAFFRDGVGLPSWFERLRPSFGTEAKRLPRGTAFETSAEAASREAVNAAFAAGLPITVLQDGRVVQVKGGSR